MSSSIENRVDSFIVDHEIDPDMKDDLQELVIGCIEDMFKHLFPLPFNSVPPPSDAKKQKKVLKADKVEDPSTVESIEELRNCTTSVLNQYCRDKNLKIGGNKKEIMDRVWRHIQGESSDEDKSSRGKPKKDKKVSEKHVCSGVKTDGSPCQISGTEEYEGCFFCYKHITDADKFMEITKKKSEPGPSSAKSKSSDDDEPPKPASTKKGKMVKKQVEHIEKKINKNQQELESEEE